jgi:uncharacterized BrkB/YihY/UPF0761 family membrane protein
VTALFTWYLRSGVAYYDVVYGSLSTTVVSMFWLYLSNYTLLMGAYLCAAISEHNKNKSSGAAQISLSD